MAGAQRDAVIKCYRAILKEGLKMPTKNRRLWVRKKAQIGFREKKNLQDESEIEFHLRLAQTHLESVQVQAEHLQQWIDDEERGKGEKLLSSQEYIKNQTNKYMEGRAKMEEEKTKKREKKIKEVSNDILVYMGSLFIQFILNVDNILQPRHL